jgi:transposase
MKRFIEGEDRQQVALLPECLDDYIGEDNPVRVVDVFVEELDLQALGFKGADPAPPVGLRTTRRCCSSSTSTAT